MKYRNIRECFNDTKMSEGTLGFRISGNWIFLGCGLGISRVAHRVLSVPYLILGTKSFCPQNYGSLMPKITRILCSSQIYHPLQKSYYLFHNLIYSRA